MEIPLLIIGAGNVGGFLSYNIEEFDPHYKVLGFLDDDIEKIGKEIYGRKVLGSISEIQNFKDQNINVVIGIANPLVKKKIAKIVEAYNFKFPAFISSKSWVSKQVKIGKGVIIYPGATINYESSIGDHVIVNLNSAIGHNCTISAYSTLAPGVNLAGFTFIEENVEIGIGVSTRQNIRIGANATIGGQSMLVRDVASGVCIIGVPGRAK